MQTVQPNLCSNRNSSGAGKIMFMKTNGAAEVVLWNSCSAAEGMFGIQVVRARSCLGFHVGGRLAGVFWIANFAAEVMFRN